MVVRVVVFLNFFCKLLACVSRREFDVVVVMIPVIYSTIPVACHLFLQGRSPAPVSFYLFLTSHSDFIAECDDFRDEVLGFKRIERILRVILGIE